MIAIIDYGMGNVGSVRNAVEALGFDAALTRDPHEIAASSHIILPGVGSFGGGMKNLTEFGLLPVLRREVLDKRKPFIGLCLGMQLLAEIGEEGGEFRGLGFISGRTRRLPEATDLKIPHVGWNDVSPAPSARLFAGIKKPIFYFVHSYYLDPQDETIIAAECEYGQKFAASIRKDNIFGVQFHPEKSGPAGLKLLENFFRESGG